MKPNTFHRGISQAVICCQLTSTLLSQCRLIDGCLTVSGFTGVQAHGYACHEGVALFAVYSYEVVIFGARSSVDDKRIKLSDPVWLDRQNPSAKSLWLRFMQLSAERHQGRTRSIPSSARNVTWHRLKQPSRTASAWHA